jgi:hypothetical protein
VSHASQTPVTEPDDLINARSEWCWNLRERFERGDTDVDPNDDQPARQFGDIKWKLTSRVRGTIARNFGGGDALWSFQGNNKLEKGVINTSGVFRFSDLPDGVTLTIDLCRCCGLARIQTAHPPNSLL